MKKGRRKILAKKITWFVLALLISILIVWLHFTGDHIWKKANSPILAILLTILSYALLNLSLARFLSNGNLTHPFPYRIAFFVAFFMGLLLIVLNNIAGTNTPILGKLLSINIGGFIGSFIASNLDMRWWENNNPPSAQIERQVLEYHQRFMEPNTKLSPAKRLFDIFFALIALLLSLPIWAIVVILIWWEDPGPILFVKNSVGCGGRNFKQLKFRSMILHAEKETGPISGYENDERVLFFGKFLRKSALDEVPQLINILLGDMSTVGPRPQRTVLVLGYLQEMPAYARRHRVRPGLAGLAQVVDTYDISPEEKLDWDLQYIQKANLWLDLKLLFSAFYLVFALRWTHESHPEIRIRKLLNVSKTEDVQSKKEAENVLSS